MPIWPKACWSLPSVAWLFGQGEFTDRLKARLQNWFWLYDLPYQAATVLPLAAQHQFDCCWDCMEMFSVPADATDGSAPSRANVNNRIKRVRNIATPCAGGGAHRLDQKLVHTFCTPETDPGQPVEWAMFSARRGGERWT